MANTCKITYLGNRSHGEKQEVPDLAVDYADHDGIKTFPNGRPVEVFPNLAAVLVSTYHATRKTPITRGGLPCFKVELTKAQLDELTAKPKAPWGIEGDFRDHYEALLANHPGSVVVVPEADEEAEDEKKKKAKP